MGGHTKLRETHAADTINQRIDIGLELKNIKMNAKESVGFSVKYVILYLDILIYLYCARMLEGCRIWVR